LKENLALQPGEKTFIALKIKRENKEKKNGK